MSTPTAPQPLAVMLVYRGRYAHLMAHRNAHARCYHKSREGTPLVLARRSYDGKTTDAFVIFTVEAWREACALPIYSWVATYENGTRRDMLGRVA